MSTLERAIALATAAHAGQVDKAGNPYVLHPLRMMLRVSGEAHRMAAMLHDVVEDTPVTRQQLGALGFARDVLEGVEALTKRDGETYFDFVERAGRNDVARPVKLADIEDNMDLTRIANPTTQDHDRILRYRRARKLLHVINREHGDPTPQAPTILPLRSRITAAEVEAECPGERRIDACDFYVEGAERGQYTLGGLLAGRILNVDHHAPLASMEAPVTSTHFAYAHLAARQFGQAGEPEPWVAINHTDCDSILSSAMLMRYVPADPELVRASVCADHTGEEHPVADLLQGLDEDRQGDRTEAQYLESLRNLQLLLAGHDVEPAAAAAIQRRRARRTAARHLVESAAFSLEKSVAVAQLPDEIDGAFFPALLPTAAVIMLSSPQPASAARRVVKLRLGKAAPAGLTLHRLRINDFDPAFGGRWNAGSNKRGGGTALSTGAYTSNLTARVVAVLDEMRSGDRDV